MDRTNYILRSLSKISKKRWEHYAINRIYHRLDDPEIEFVCQQCIRRNDDQIALVDLFLPQLNIYLEIDEGHHESDDSKIRDAIRYSDIVEASGLEEERISANGVTLQDFTDSIDAFVERVHQLKEEIKRKNKFFGWNYERRFTAEPHLEVGFIEIGVHSAFRTQKDALECFGYSGGTYRKGVWKLPDYVRDTIGLSGPSIIWFPKLYPQDIWDNSLSKDGLVVTQICKDPDFSEGDTLGQRIIMARSRDELNRVLYRFVGVFEGIPEHRYRNKHRFRRIASRVKTYSAG